MNNTAAFSHNGDRNLLIKRRYLHDHRFYPDINYLHTADQYYQAEWATTGRGAGIYELVSTLLLSELATVRSLNSNIPLLYSAVDYLFFL